MEFYTSSINSDPVIQLRTTCIDKIGEFNLKTGTEIKYYYRNCILFKIVPIKLHYRRRLCAVQ